MCLNCIGHISSYIAKKATSVFVYLFLKKIFSYNLFNQTKFLFIFSTLSQSLQLYSLGSIWEFIREWNDHKGMERNWIEWNGMYLNEGKEWKRMELNEIK